MALYPSHFQRQYNSTFSPLSYTTTTPPPYRDWETHSKANAVAELLESPYEFWLAYWNVNEKIKNWQFYTLIGFNANELLVMDLVCNYNELLGKIPKPDISFITEK